jgi:uncharacterized protein YbjT (DUF2867 family)
MKKVLITGATGATGGNAIKKLLELELPVRALVHKVDECSEKLSSQGVEIVRGDLSDFEAVSEALQGITRRQLNPIALMAAAGLQLISFFRLRSPAFWRQLLFSPRRPLNKVSEPS